MINSLSKVLSATIIVVSLVLITLVLIASLVSSYYGTEDFELASTFEMDEFRMSVMLLDDINDGEVDPDGFYHYGNTHNTFMFFVGIVLKEAGFRIDERFAIVLGRVLSFLFYIIAILLVFRLAAHFSDGNILIAIVVALFFSMMPVASYWGSTLHPDMIQLVLFLLSLYSLFTIKSDLRFVVAAMFAGFAAGTLYQPLAYLAMLVSYAVFIQFNSKKSLKKKLLRSVVVTIVVLAVAVIAFFSVNLTMIDNMGKVSIPSKQSNRGLKQDGGMIQKQAWTSGPN
jgi:hypothetical protein